MFPNGVLINIYEFVGDFWEILNLKTVCKGWNIDSSCVRAIVRPLIKSDYRDLVVVTYAPNPILFSLRHHIGKSFIISEIDLTNQQIPMSKLHQLIIKCPSLSVLNVSNNFLFNFYEFLEFETEESRSEPNNPALSIETLVATRTSLVYNGPKFPQETFDFFPKLKKAVFAKSKYVARSNILSLLQFKSLEVLDLSMIFRASGSRITSWGSLILAEDIHLKTLLLENGEEIAENIINILQVTYKVNVVIHNVIKNLDSMGLNPEIIRTAFKKGIHINFFSIDFIRKVVQTESEDDALAILQLLADHQFRFFVSSDRASNINQIVVETVAANGWFRVMKLLIENGFNVCGTPESVAQKMILPAIQRQKYDFLKLYKENGILSYATSNPKIQCGVTCGLIKVSNRNILELFLNGSYLRTNCLKHPNLVLFNPKIQAMYISHLSSNLGSMTLEDEICIYELAVYRLSREEIDHFKTLIEFNVLDLSKEPRLYDRVSAAFWSKYKIDPITIHLIGKGDLTNLRYLYLQNQEIIYTVPNNWSPFHYACNLGDVEIVDFFLSIGCSPTDLDSNGYEGVHYAICNGHKEVVRLLDAYGARQTTMDVQRQRLRRVNQQKNSLNSCSSF